MLAAGAEVPADRMIDGMDMRGFLLGEAEESGRDAILHIQGNRLQAVKWHQWKAHLFQQDDFYSTWSPYNIPHIYNLEWDPREEHQVDFPHAWVLHPMAAAVGAFMKTLVAEPPIKPGTPDPYMPPKPGTYKPQTHLQLGVITQFVTTLVESQRDAGAAHRVRPQLRLSHDDHVEGDERNGKDDDEDIGSAGKPPPGTGVRVFLVEHFAFGNPRGHHRSRSRRLAG
jgi:hypothetical protein